jgi:3-phosphoshikimate 1-carboxyvinyltransferase
MPTRAAQIAALSLPLDRLPDPLPIPVIERPFDVTIRPPGSKSITNRALLLAALADGTSELRGALIDADDAQVMLRAIERLGARVEIIRGSGGGTGSLSASDTANHRSAPRAGKPPVPPQPPDLDVVRITGVNGRWRIPSGQTITLNLHNAGTATRFLTAAAILAPPDSGGIIIDGDARMRERPIGELADALVQLGIRVKFLGATGFPPLRIVAPIDLRSLDDTATLDRAASSQFISALMMTAPFLPKGLTLRFKDPPSWPYIKMTQAMLEDVGVNTDDDCGHAMTVWSGSRHSAGATGTTGIRAFSSTIEPDASGATYFAAACVLTAHSRLFLGDARSVTDGCLQGDAAFFEVVHAVGGRLDEIDAGTVVSSPSKPLAPINWDFAPIPDTAMTAAVLACFASPTPDNPGGAATSTLRGLRTLRVKETDRLEALRVELSKLGAKVEIFREGEDEGLRIMPGPGGSAHGGGSVSPIHFDTYRDHRMAMSLALVGLRRPNVFIRDPACVAKTYPTFWRDLAKLYS